MAHVFLTVITIIASFANNGQADADIKIVTGTDLLTGVGYNIRTYPLSPFSVMTWADKYTANDENYVQMDGTQGRVSSYAKGGTLFRTGMMSIEESEKPGYYTIFPVSYPKEILVAYDVPSSPDGKSPEARYVIMSKLPQYAKGGAKRDNALWKISGFKRGANAYNLDNLGVEGCVTVSNQSSDEGYDWLTIEPAIPNEYGERCESQVFFVKLIEMDV